MEHQMDKNFIRLTRDDKLFMLILCKQGYITDEQRKKLENLLSTSVTTIRFVSTYKEIEELKRLDELREKFGISKGEEPDEDILNEIKKEIEDYRNEIRNQRNATLY